MNLEILNGKDMDICLKLFVSFRIVIFDAKF